METKLVNEFPGWSQHLYLALVWSETLGHALGPNWTGSLVLGSEMRFSELTLFPVSLACFKVGGELGTRKPSTVLLVESSLFWEGRVIQFCWLLYAVSQLFRQSIHWR